MPLHGLQAEAPPPDELEAEGRETDTIVGHLTPGEVVIPLELLNDPNLSSALQGAFQSIGADMAQFTVGSEANSINPETGYPEFFHGGSRRRKRRARARARQEYQRQRQEAQARFNSEMAELRAQGDLNQAQAKKEMSGVRATDLLFKRNIKNKYRQLRREGTDVPSVSIPSIDPITSKKFSKKKFKRISRIAGSRRSPVRPK